MLATIQQRNKLVRGPWSAIQVIDGTDKGGGLCPLWFEYRK